MKGFLMKPPKIIKGIFDRIPLYRKWYIKQVFKTIKEDALNELQKEYCER